MTTAPPEIAGTHPYANKFPMLSDAELDELAESIKTVGLLHPVIVTPKGLVLDGRNRLEACGRAQVEATVEVYDGDDYAEFVIACNVARRNMSTGARAMSTALVLAADGRRENGRWDYGEVRQSFTGKDSNGLGVAVSKCGVILDFTPDLANQVVADEIGLRVAYERAIEARDAERIKLERQERERLEESEAKEFVQANAPDLAAQAEASGWSWISARTEWERRNREEASRLAKEKADKERREKEERDARSDLYSGILRAVGTCAAYGEYEDIPKLMADYNPAELNPHQLERHLDQLELARRLCDELIKWRDQR